ncbi:MAG: ATP-binding cassette domain-containing protein, partial [Chloroflexi bacterium]|nr:ATP-binding cassette domain-containing protein [Chloroflexota bacterium]
VKHYFQRKGLFGVDPRPVQALSGVSFTISRGETLGLVGETGCGKSTLARQLLRLEEPTSGKVMVGGKDLGEFRGRRMKDFRRQAQLIFQDPYDSIPERMTIGNIVADPLHIHHLGSKKERREKALEMLRLVGLKNDDYDRYPAEFSAGQRQRVSIARALSLEPKLILCDEPISSLDVSIQAQILNLLIDLQDKFQLTYLFISHDLGVVKYVSARVMVMYLGLIMELAPADEIFDTPLHPYTEALMAAIPGLEKRGARMVIKGETPNPINPPSGCRFHPRCHKVMDICSQEVPVLGKIEGSNHLVACHLHKVIPVEP